jgi:hypothetical protein
MEPEQKSWSLEDVIKLLSLIYIFLTTAGLVYNFFFYRTFGINIIEYIDVSEVLILFTPMLNDFVILTFLLIYPFIFIGRRLMFSKPKFDNRKKLTGWKALVVGVILLSIVIGLFVYLLVTINATPTLISFGIFIAFAPVLLDFLFKWLKEKHETDVPIMIRELAIIFISFIIVTVYLVFAKISYMEKITKTTKFEIVFKNNEPKIQSDSTIYYLGRTKNYIFIRDFKLNYTKVLNVSDVKEFVIFGLYKIIP